MSHELVMEPFFRSIETKLLGFSLENVSGMGLGYATAVEALEGAGLGV